MRISKEPEIRRAELVEAARELFDKNGIKNTQVSQIVDKVGVAKGLFYYYFKSKEEIVNEVVSVVMSELREASERILADDTLTFYQKASEFLALYMDMIDQFSGDEEENLANMLEVFSRNSIAQDANDLLQEQISRLLEQGVKENILTTAYPEETIRILILGLLAQSRKQLLSMEQIMTIIEQAMHMPAGSLKKGGGE
nr:TetR/AcrR family transcriptional regulator [uncultured Eisenbergiella sp.]